MLRIAIQRRQGDFTLSADLALPKAGVTAIFGRSGAGKTTLVQCLAGLQRPDRGRIALGDTLLFDRESRVDLPPEQRRLGYVFQDARLFPHLSVEANLRYGLRRAPKGESVAGFDEVAELLALAPLLARRPGSLSGGERQRVALGRALLAQPRLLLLDEPLASLDQARKDEVLPFLERLRDRYALPMIYVSHAMPEVLRLADALVLLDRGRVAAAGTVEEILGRIDLQPLTGRYEAGAVVTATVVDEDRPFGLTRLDVAGETLWIGRIEAPAGSRVRLRIRARDVALAAARVPGVSIQNQLAGRVAELRRDGHYVDLAITVGAESGGQRLWSRVTARAADQLALAEGKAIVALVRTVAVERQGVARQPED